MNIYIFVYVEPLFNIKNLVQKIWEIPESDEIKKIEQGFNSNPAVSPDLIVSLKSDELNSDQQRIVAQIRNFDEVSHIYLFTSIDVSKK